MKIQSSIWGAPGTFPFLLAMACRGEYQQAHQPGVFPEPLARVTQTLELDPVGRSLLFLGSDLVSEAEQKRREANEAMKKAGKRLQFESTRLGHQANAAALAEESERLGKRHQLVSSLLFAYARAVTPEFQNGAPSMSFTADGKILADFDDEQIVDSALPQGHLARQAALYVIRILAGNDDPTQIGIGDNLRAFRLGLNDVDTAEVGEEIAGEEALATIEDVVLKRISTLLDALTFAELGLPVTLDTIGNQIPQAVRTLEASIDLVRDIFWSILDETVVALHEQRGVTIITLREDWALVNGEELTPRRKAERALGELIEGLIGQLSGPLLSLGFPELNLSGAPPETIERLRAHVANCQEEGCPYGLALARFDAERAAEQQDDRPEDTDAEASTKEAEAPQPSAES
jgi:hypothetical protein